jgi:hypothetical protein
MIRRIVWILGMALFLWLCWHFAVWRLFWQMALVGATLLWVLLGLLLLSQKRVTSRPVIQQRPVVAVGEVSQRIRAQFVSQFGEQAAAKLERDDIAFWDRIAWRETSQK